MPELFAAERIMFAAQTQQGLHILKDVLLFSCPAGEGKCIFRVIGPTAGKVSAIVRIASTGHGDFVAIVELGDSAQGENQTESEFEFGWRSSRHAFEARGVLIGEER